MGELESFSPWIISELESFFPWIMGELESFCPNLRCIKQRSQTGDLMAVCFPDD